MVYEENLAAVEHVLDASNVLIFKDKGVFHITTDGIIMKSIVIHDLMGRLLYENNNIDSSTFNINELNQTKEILLLKIRAKDLQSVTLKIIN